MLWLTNANPATAPYAELFDDSKLQKPLLIIKSLTAFRYFSSISLLLALKIKTLSQCCALRRL